MKIGDIVVCIDDEIKDPIPPEHLPFNMPRKDQYYRVTSVKNYKSGAGVTVDRADPTPWLAFSASRFQKLEPAEDLFCEWLKECLTFKPKFDILNT